MPRVPKTGQTPYSKDSSLYKKNQRNYWNAFQAAKQQYSTNLSSLGACQLGEFEFLNAQYRIHLATDNQHLVINIPEEVFLEQFIKVTNRFKFLKSINRLLEKQIEKQNSSNNKKKTEGLVNIDWE